MTTEKRLSGIDAGNESARRKLHAASDGESPRKSILHDLCAHDAILLQLKPISNTVDWSHGEEQEQLRHNTYITPRGRVASADGIAESFRFAHICFALSDAVFCAEYLHQVATENGSVDVVSAIERMRADAPPDKAEIEERFNHAAEVMGVFDCVVHLCRRLVWQLTDVVAWAIEIRTEYLQAEHRLPSGEQLKLVAEDFPQTASELVQQIAERDNTFVDLESRVARASRGLLCYGCDPLIVLDQLANTKCKTERGEYSRAADSFHRADRLIWNAMCLFMDRADDERRRVLDELAAYYSPGEVQPQSLSAAASTNTIGRHDSEFGIPLNSRAEHILEVLNEAPRILTIEQIIQNLTKKMKRAGRGTVGKALGLLEKNDLVERREGKNSGWSITDRGRKTARTLRPAD